MKMRRSPGLLLAVMCVVASIVVSDAASARSWLAGGHATPGQLALHLFYESLGVHDHHGSAPVEDAGDAASEQASFVAGPALTIAIPAGAADPGQVARDFRDAIAIVPSPASTLTRLPNHDDPRPASPDFLVFDPPPRVAA
ncbi:MAG: hypothetical protein U0893_03875 [Chloroflexota bacterium]